VIAVAGVPGSRSRCGPRESIPTSFCGWRATAARARSPLKTAGLTPGQSLSKIARRHLDRECRGQQRYHAGRDEGHAPSAVNPRSAEPRLHGLSLVISDAASLGLGLLDFLRHFGEMLGGLMHLRYCHITQADAIGEHRVEKSAGNPAARLDGVAMG
jgi:hypothetical protein